MLIFGHQIWSQYEHPRKSIIQFSTKKVVVHLHISPVRSAEDKNLLSEEATKYRDKILNKFDKDRYKWLKVYFSWFLPQKINF